MFTDEYYERLLVKYAIVSKSQGSSILRIGKNDNNCRKTNSELKNVILDLFEQMRQANVRNAEKHRANAENDRIIASLNRKMNTVLESRRQQRLNLESWLANER